MREIRYDVVNLCPICNREWSRENSIHLSQPMHWFTEMLYRQTERIKAKHTPRPEVCPDCEAGSEPED